jgi:hypothetical protein
MTRERRLRAVLVAFTALEWMVGTVVLVMYFVKR